MAFQVEEMAYDLIAAVGPLVSQIKRQDRALADQLTRAASSVALNIAESSYSDPVTAGRVCLRLPAAPTKPAPSCASLLLGATARGKQRLRRRRFSTKSFPFSGSSRIRSGVARGGAHGCASGVA